MLLNSDDRVLPFQVEGLDVRGRVVRLGESINTVLTGHDYPASVSKVLGEAVALAVLLGSSLKIDGRFQLQTRTDGPIDMLVVDFEAPDSMRAYARFDEERLNAANGAPTGELLGKGHQAWFRLKAPGLKMPPMNSSGSRNRFRRADGWPSRKPSARANMHGGQAEFLFSFCLNRVKACATFREAMHRKAWCLRPPMTRTPGWRQSRSSRQSRTMN